ncbi:hypothetical protein F5I97DRAFT_1092069 [Phlebopus sp. FC_14]|nr:hypothetical protein F5I97DRAFT_1092069 [Phlebopus sp. FC_14]
MHVHMKERPPYKGVSANVGLACVSLYFHLTVCRAIPLAWLQMSTPNITPANCVFQIFFRHGHLKWPRATQRTANRGRYKSVGETMPFKSPCSRTQHVFHSHFHAA